MHKTPEITRLIHENFWVVLSFAFGRPALSKVIEERFHGDWKYLNKTVYERAEIRADRALLEMATQLRVLDDAENLSAYGWGVEPGVLGEVIQADGARTPLYVRDLTNKVMHAAYFKWDLSKPNDPKVNCLPHDPTRWKVIGALTH
jgi:hypothetical protein